MLKLNGYEDDLEANSLYYDGILENQTLSDEQREAIEIQRQEKEDEIRENKNKQKKRAFLFNQALAIAEIGINLAKTISAINLAAAFIDTITFGLGGTPYRAANIPLAIGVAAAQSSNSFSYNNSTVCRRWNND